VSHLHLVCHFASAPMSKVVDFLPPNVYRALINRNIIHPPSKDEAFLFDICLLGDCDNVVRVIKDQLMRSDISASTIDKLVRFADDKDTSWLKQQPHDTVLLFDGAVTNTVSDHSSIQKLIEVVYCDGCSKEIKCQIHCCQTCFDFDLCSQCFPTVSRVHADGNHKFVLENAASPDH
jgi:hypothetical protein